MLTSSISHARRVNWRQPLSQAVKAALAALIAWVLARDVFTLPQPFLAPYAAVFIIEATVYRSLRVAGQQVAAVGLGVLLAAVASALPLSMTGAIGVVVLAGMLLGNWRRLGASGIWVGVTALLVVSYGTADQPVLLLDRLVEIGLGATVGLVVNAALLPPIYLRRPREATAELATAMAALLRELAASLHDGDAPDGWADHARAAESLVVNGENAVRWSEESARLNLRRRRERRVVAEEWEPALTALRRAWPHLRELAEAVAVTSSDDRPFASPDVDSRRAFADVLRELAQVVTQRGQPGGSAAEAGYILRHAEDALRQLERQLDRHDGPTRTAAGLASMLLPAGKAAVELRPD